MSSLDPNTVYIDHTGKVINLDVINGGNLKVTQYDSNGDEIGIDGNPSRIAIADGPNLDAFSRLRVSNPNVIFDSHETTDEKDILWSENTAGSGSIAYIQNQSSHNLSVSGDSGDRATRRTKKLMQYIPGTSMLIMCTGVMGVGAINSRQRIGLFNGENGLFFEQRDGVIGVTKRTYTSGSIVEHHYTQSEWNLNKYPEFDNTKTHIFIIDLQWLGVGRVRFGFDINGSIEYVHEIRHDNTLSVVYMTTPLLPIKYEVENVGASSPQNDFRQICSCAIAEGGVATDAIPKTINNGITGVATTNAQLRPIISLRLKDSFSQKANIRITNVGPLTLGKRDHLFVLVYNPTLTGANFQDVDGIAQKDVSATAITGGTHLTSFYTSAENRAPFSAFENRFALGSEYDHTNDIVTVAAWCLTGTDSVVCSIDYEELY